MTTWNDTQPIYVQIRQIIIDLILNQEQKSEDALPSVRQISTELSVNPLTVTRAYQSLVELGIVEKKRGLGMFLTSNAREKLLRHQREKFLCEDWPRITAQIKTLGLSVADLIADKKEQKTDARKR
jgi:DNA-binding transcriptional regulator YhcF (GntR family)